MPAHFLSGGGSPPHETAHHVRLSGIARLMATAPPTPPRVPLSTDRPAAAGAVRFLETVLASGIADPAAVDAAEAAVRKLPGMAGAELQDPAQFDQAVAKYLVDQGVLTEFQAGQLLLGRKKFNLGQYRILDQIGRGGMGLVFLAEHDLMGRRVAIKVLQRKKSTEESEMVFRREIRMLGRLDHNNLVRALDAGYDGKVFFLVTEFVPGIDLNRQIKRHGVFDELTAASVITQAAHALGYAHEEGVVHRDVKPGNIIVTDDGRVKLLDLGLAGSMLADEAMQLNRIVGTMDYIAPEQVQDPDNVGPSADIYSLGCTLYFTVTGQVPYPGGSREDKPKRHLYEKPPRVQEHAPHVSKAFCSVIDGMLLKEPSDRYQSMAEVIDALAPWRPPDLVPMFRGETAGIGAVGDVEPLASEPQSGSTHSRGSDPWVLDDVDGVGDHMVIEPPGRDEVFDAGPSVGQRGLRIAVRAAATGSVAAVVSAGLAAVLGGETSTLIVAAVGGGVLAAAAVAAWMSIAAVLQQS